MAYTLTHPSGRFTVAIEDIERRDILVKRGYTVANAEPVEPAPRKTQTTRKPA